MPRRPSDPPSTTKPKRAARRTRPNAHEHAERSPQSDPARGPHRSMMSAQDWYRAEKARRGRGRESQELLDAARAEYLALLASEAGGPKGGRPRKTPRPKAKRPLDEIELAGEDALEAIEDGHDEEPGRETL